MLPHQLDEIINHFVQLEINLSNKMQQLDDKVSLLDSTIKENEKRKEAKKNLLCFDSQCMNERRITLSQDKQTAIVVHGVSWDCALLANRICKRWKITIHDDPTEGGDIMIGLADKPSWTNTYRSKFNTSKCYMYYCQNGKLYGANGSVSGKEYANRNRLSSGSTVECVYENGDLSFIVNEVNHGVAFSNLPDDLYPAIECAFECSFSITKLD